MKILKKGFSLVEIMVVVVIIGVLASIAVPNLMGVVSKAKASEVVVVVGEWERLEMAYIDDKHVGGTWQEIGFIAPGKKVDSDKYETKYFIFKENISQQGGGGNINGIQVYNTVVLDDCKASSTEAHWAFEIVSLENKAPYIRQPGTSNDMVCAALTPSLQGKYASK